MSAARVLDDAGRAQAAEAAAHWADLAVKEENMAHWYESRGLPYGNVDSYYARAETYRRTAESLRREAASGQAHCSTCGGAHANYEHSALPASAHNARCRCGLAACPWCRGKS